MLFFTYDREIPPKAKELFETVLRERTGQDCVVLDCGCTGVYDVPLTKDEAKKETE